MGQALSEGSQRALLRAKLKAGCILHIFCDFTNPPKNKFAVVVHIDHEENFMLVFLINSRISQLIQNDPHLRTCQIPLLQASYPFLDHDSHLNCTQIYDGVEIDPVINSLRENPNNFKGHLLDNEILEILQAVNSTRTISDYDKKLILASLGD